MSALPERYPAAGPSGLADPRHIEIVSSREQRRARPRFVAAVATVAGLFAILAAQLLLTIATSEGAYEIAALQTQQRELGRDEQVLLEQLQILDAPQHLAAEAQVMGMVASQNAAYVRLSDGVVLGTPVAATASSALRTADDGTSLIPNALLADVPLVGAAALPVAAAGSAASAVSPGAPAAAAADGSVTSTPPAGIPIPNTH